MYVTTLDQDPNADEASEPFPMPVYDMMNDIKVAKEAQIIGEPFWPTNFI